MIIHKIPNTDLNISSITLGTWVFGGDMWQGSKEEDCVETVLAALDYGINTIDTAPIYGYGISEKIVGKAIKGKRDKVVLATKCGLIGKGKNIKTNLSASSINREVEDSLRRLQTDYIDIYQCHWPDSETPIEETFDCLNKLKEAGKIRHIGVSNFSKDLLAQSIPKAHIVTLQNQYSLLERSLENEILPFCKEKGVGLITYGPLAGGILSGKYLTQPKFKGFDARNFFYKYYEGNAFNKTKKFLEYLSKIKKPLNQIAINWIRQQEGITSVIVGCRNKEQVKQNASAADWDLSEADLERIESALKIL